jgi:hypothetical protein
VQSRRSFRSYGATVIGIALASAASAEPILTVVPDVIPHSPTVVTVEVDPNGTPLSGVLLNFSSLASGLEMIDVVATDVEIESSGPAQEGANYEGSFGGAFDIDKTLPFEVGTLELEGFVDTTPLVLTGEYIGSGPEFVGIPIDPTDVAVVPEPAMPALQLAALATIFGLSRSRVSHRLRPARSDS